MYPEHLVAPMRQEVVELGFEELRTAEQARDALTAREGTALVFVNSVCGCAAGMARPGLALALKHGGAVPDRLYTVFAGNDADATQTARSFFTGYAPSSPCMGLLKDGKLAAIIQRLDIEGHNAQQVADQLVQAFEAHCA